MPAATAAKPVRLSNLFDQPNGFDTIRLLAASAVIVSHGFVLTGAVEPLDHLTGGQATIGTLAVSAFFVISGFLIPASFDRGGIARYAVKRARRILPALVVAVLLCAMVLGPLATQLPLGAYFADPATWRFLGHALFLPVGYDLPGVFADHPLSAVNGSLWSLKYEVACYVLVPLALMLAPLRKAAVIAAWLASFAIARLVPPDAGGALYHLGQLAELFRFFGAGMLLYLYRAQIQLRPALAWLCLGVAGVGALTPLFNELAATLGAYALIAFAGLCGERFRQVTARGDISYGVYVLAFPIQQLLVPATLGFAMGGIVLGWLANALLALPLAYAAGALSWFLVERPALGGSAARHGAGPLARSN